MFRTEVGPGKNKTVAYARPETAQGIFVPYKRLYEFVRRKLPFGVLQIGKAYRNEISPRQGMIRLREFSQAEVEIFVEPENRNHPRFKEIENEKLRLYPVSEQKENGKILELTAKEAVRKNFMDEIIAYYLVLSKKLFMEIGIPYGDMRCRQHLPTERAHYSRDTWDTEINTSLGWIEVVGHADRSDYDLKSHGEASRTELTAFVDGKKIIPHVIEPSYGIDRLFYCVLEKAYRTAGDKKEWASFEFEKCVAPYAVVVCPLDTSGTIGRRYARADEIGIPYAVTLDSETLTDNTVTVRDRDTKKQIRVETDKLPYTLRKLLENQIEIERAGKAI